MNLRHLFITIACSVPLMIRADDPGGKPKRGDEKRSEIVGRWMAHYDNGPILKILQLNADNTFTFKSGEWGPSNKGTWRLEKDKVILNDVEAFRLEDGKLIGDKQSIYRAMYPYEPFGR